MAEMTLQPPVVGPDDMEVYKARPMVDGRKILRNGEVLPWKGDVQEVFAPIYNVRLSREPGHHSSTP